MCSAIFERFTPRIPWSKDTSGDQVFGMPVWYGDEETGDLPPDRPVTNRLARYRWVHFLTSWKLIASSAKPDADSPSLIKTLPITERNDASNVRDTGRGLRRCQHDTAMVAVVNWQWSGEGASYKGAANATLAKPPGAGGLLVPLQRVTSLLLFIS